MEFKSFWLAAYLFLAIKYFVYVYTHLQLSEYLHTHRRKLTICISLLLWPALAFISASNLLHISSVWPPPFCIISHAVCHNLYTAFFKYVLKTKKEFSFSLLHTHFLLIFFLSVCISLIFYWQYFVRVSHKCMVCIWCSVHMGETRFASVC